MAQKISKSEKEHIKNGTLTNGDFIKNKMVLENNNISENEGVDRITTFFANKTVLITGGTGFLGKVVIEKLLRCCGDVKKIYLLIREKKGKSAKERLKELFSNPLFDLLKCERGEENIFKQVEVIQGDILLFGLGISNEEKEKLSNEVQLIYHIAATIRFDESLYKSVLINTRGTKYMLDFARQCKKLTLFRYCSTAFCVCKEKIVYEKPYPPPADPHEIIKLCEILGEEKFGLIAKEIQGYCPNTYCFTKALAEDLVAKTFDELPSAILRPSIITPILRDPLPGWTDNINGPMGLLIGAGKGVIRTMYCNADGYGDYLPADIAVNGILIESWYSKCINQMQNRVVHMTSSNEIKVTWKEVVDIGQWIAVNKVPFNTIAWYPGGSIKSSRFWHNVSMVLFQWIPAVIGDIFIWLAGYPPVLIRVQKRIMKGYEVFEYYTNRQFYFDNTNALKIRSVMNKNERNIYPVRMDDVDFDLYKYFESGALAARRYILKTPDDMIPAARLQMRIMWFLDRFCKTAFLLCVTYFIYKLFFAKFFST